MDNVNLELTPDRAEFFILCEKERAYLEKCLKVRHKFEKLFNFKQTNIMAIVGSSIIIDSDISGNWHNIKVILNEHY